MVIRSSPVASLLKVTSNALNVCNIRHLKQLKLELPSAPILGGIGLQNEQYEYPIVPLVAHFANCRSIQIEELTIPSKFWSERDSFDMFVNLTTDKVEMHTLICNFDNYEDNEGKVFDLLEGIIQDDSRDYLFMYLRCVNTERLQSFGKHFVQRNIKLTSRVGRDLDNCGENIVDVFTLSLSKS